MDFELTEEQRIIQKTIRDFATKELAPVADELDEKEEFPHQIFKRIGELGLLGMLLPQEYGGSDAGELSLALAIEEIAKACASTADIVDSAAVIGTVPIFHYGTEEQKQRFLPSLATGEKISSYAISEPDAGSDIGAIRTRAVKDGDTYILNGQKTFITCGNVCDMAVVFAMIPELAPRGMTAFIVEYGTKGFSKGEKFKKLGMHAATNCEFFFEDCPIPAANRLGEEGKGMRIALATLDHGRIGIAAQAVGIAQAVLEKCTDYAKTRIQFGSPIAKNQAISFKLADMATEIAAARFLYYHAASLADNGKPFSINAAMAKLYASELAMRASTAGIQIFGGYGYMMEYPMQRYFRDAKLTELYEGTSEVQRMVISRGVLG
ncbi:MAG TPA: acyl-CoA dehydrogenase family protein, partial [Desulfatiglandales bacterium]|nr:acyl-CoA dehydrogenase family protein [Desulfatiglandales bacterium]